MIIAVRCPNHKFAKHANSANDRHYFLGPARWTRLPWPRSSTSCPSSSRPSSATTTSPSPTPRGRWQRPSSPRTAGSRDDFIQNMAEHFCNISRVGSFQTSHFPHFRNTVMFSEFDFPEVLKSNRIYCSIWRCATAG